MRYNPDKHHRRSIRLKDYDYSQPGWYFITIVVQKREMLFGHIINHTMVLNDAGKMVQSIWYDIPEFYPGIQIDAFQIMPNHMHGVINIEGTDPRVCLHNKQPNVPGQFQRRQSRGGQSQGIASTRLSLGDVVQRYKSLTTKRYIDGVKKQHWPSFNGKLWQRNYWERIIRNEAELNHIRKYIIENPLKWQAGLDK